MYTINLHSKSNKHSKFIFKSVEIYTTNQHFTPRTLENRENYPFGYTIKLCFKSNIHCESMFQTYSNIHQRSIFQGYNMLNKYKCNKIKNLR